MRNVLNRIKNRFSDIYYLFFNKNRKFDFSADSARCAAFIDTGAKLKGRQERTQGEGGLRWAITPPFALMLIKESTVKIHEM